MKQRRWLHDDERRCVFSVSRATPAERRCPRQRRARAIVCTDSSTRVHADYIRPGHGATGRCTRSFVQSRLLYKWQINFVHVGRKKRGGTRLNRLIGTLKPQTNGLQYDDTAIRWLVHWPLMGGLLHLVQRGGDWAGPQPTHQRLVYQLRIIRCSTIIIVFGV